MKHTPQHPGFQAVQRKVAADINPQTGRPYGPTVAAAITAARSRAASDSTKNSNPRLNRVKGK